MKMTQKLTIETDICTITIEPKGNITSLDSIVKDIIWRLYIGCGDDRIKIIKIRKEW